MTHVVQPLQLEEQLLLPLFELSHPKRYFVLEIPRFAGLHGQHDALEEDGGC